MSSVLTLGFGVLGFGLVMLRGGFGRATAIAGVVTGAVSIASVAETALTGTFPVLVVGASLLTIAWLILVGVDLLRLPRSARNPSGSASGSSPVGPLQASG